ncbi:PREDICTED: vesicle-associated membrane protein 5 [Chrysochloris asiatica]|uniref:Vesicle-associated membrane protein 5 n=1 Tax=Chrysochloris asiatica TaxID=185453 RepID=A0A9B0WRY5_CHRAS|nr:PREDICTED: vesicle-associated membrane protein 5 [Chrysochloris asiatica]
MWPDEGQMGTSCSPDLGLGAQAGKELKQCQQQADEVTEIMLNNFEKVLERDGKLAELEERSHQLLDMSTTFSKTTKTLAQKKRWENTRCRIYLGLVLGGGLLVILIVLLAFFLQKNGEGSSAPEAQEAQPQDRGTDLVGPVREAEKPPWPVLASKEPWPSLPSEPSW